MTLPGRASRPPGLLRWTAPFKARPRLTVSLATGLAVGIALAVAPVPLTPGTEATLAWDVACCLFIALILRNFADRTPAHIRQVAATQDEGQGLILGLVLVAASASLAVVGLELSTAKGDHGWIKGARVGLAFATVAASWFVVQIIFALHYAHEFYADRDHDPKTDQQGGLGFPGNELPDYWDFLHFSVVIGVAAQTADIAFTSKTMRRTGTVHSLVAFTFNTVVLALTINLLAGLFQ